MPIAYKCVDGGYIGTTNLTNADTTKTAPLGTLVQGLDPTYGEGDFIYAAFTGTCAAGDFVVMDRAAKTAVQASTATSKGQIGIAMAAQVTGQFGWVMLRGIHDGANVATGVTAGLPLYLTATAGRPNGTVVAGNKIDGAFERLITAASNVGTVELEWPGWTGNG